MIFCPAQAPGLLQLQLQRAAVYRAFADFDTFRKRVASFRIREIGGKEEGVGVVRIETLRRERDTTWHKIPDRSRMIKALRHTSFAGADVGRANLSVHRRA